MLYQSLLKPDEKNDETVFICRSDRGRCGYACDRRAHHALTPETSDRRGGFRNSSASSLFYAFFRAEAAEGPIFKARILAGVALAAVLLEYAVDMYFVSQVVCHSEECPKCFWLRQNIFPY